MSRYSYRLHKVNPNIKHAMKTHADEQRRRQDRTIADAARHGEDFDDLALTPDNRLTDRWRFD